MKKYFHSAHNKLYYNKFINITYAHMIIAIVMLTVIIFATVIMWPINPLGYSSNFTSNIIIGVDKAGSADIAGIVVGDRVITLHGYPIEDAKRSLNIFSLIRTWDRPVELVVEREGQYLSFSLFRKYDATFLIFKIILFITSISCWLSGYSLGLVRYHELPSSSAFVGMYWMTMGGVIGTLLYAQFAALPLYLFLIWILASVIFPMTIYVHSLFPYHQSVGVVKNSIGIWILSISVILNLSFVIWSIYQDMSVTQFLSISYLVIPTSLVISLGGSAWILHKRYILTTVAHIQRQMRMIGIVCASIMLCWLLFNVLPQVLLGSILIRERWLILLCALLPLSYVVDHRVADLYRLEQFMRRGFAHLATTTSLLGILVIAIQALGLRPLYASFWLTVAFIAMYRPFQHMWMRVIPAPRVKAQQALQQTIRAFSDSLELDVLAKTLLDGIQLQFSKPAFALYLRDTYSDDLHQYAHERMPDLPPSLLVGRLTAIVREMTIITESRSLPRYLGHQFPLRQDEETMINYPGVSLWCSIRDSEGNVLGLLLLGLRGDLDPYRHHDFEILLQVLAAASMALRNSATYRLQVEDKEMIRTLLRQVQETKDTITRTIARELHDTMINDYLYVSIGRLNKLTKQLPPELAPELNQILANEYAFADALRSMCDDLHPTGIDDTFHGLPTILRKQVLRIQERWPGECHFKITGDHRPVSSHVQYEALRIAKEAMDNTLKHADATKMHVRLNYPRDVSQPVRLVVKDNGRNAHTVQVRSSHRGMYYMQESAQSVGGQLTVEVKPGRSTAIIFSFPSR